jgi:hypothetical protein
MNLPKPGMKYGVRQRVKRTQYGMASEWSEGACMAELEGGDGDALSFPSLFTRRTTEWSAQHKRFKHTRMRGRKCTHVGVDG